MKKISVAITAILMMALIVSGCGKSASAPASTNTKTNSKTDTGSNTKTGSKTNSSSSTANITVWDIQTGPLQKTFKAANQQFNDSHKDIHAKLQFYSNDNYKQKIQIAMAANNPPDVIFGWGGGVLKTYVDAKKVVNLDDMLKANPDYKKKFFPGVWGNVTFNGHVYGVPEGTGTQPELLFYNKTMLNKYNLPVPKTWDQLLSDVKTLKSHHVIPISIGARDQWPDLMWLMYLTDRVGGPDVFKNILENKPNAWSDPAVLKAATMIQQLVDAGAFGNGYSSVSANSNQDIALLYSGKAAMLLQGDWVFPNIKSSAPDFTKNDLSWALFPSVQGGKGDPNDLMGNITNYYYISAKSKNIKAAEQYVRDVPLSDLETKQDIPNGIVPPVKGLSDQLSSAPNSAFLKSVYSMAEKAPVYVTGWDQLLPPSEAQVLLKQLSALFLKGTTPQKFVDAMNNAIPKS